MNLAAALALAAATLNLGSGVLHLALSRAPGWRHARVFAFLALTAGLHAVGSVLFTLEVSDGTARVLGRLTYFFAHIHGIGWLVHAHGGADGSWRAMRPLLQRLGLGSLALALVMLATGWHLGAEVDAVEIEWAHVTYHYARSTLAGDVYAFAILAQLAVPFVHYVRAARQQVPGARLQLAGFAAFLLCAIDEALVANRALAFLALADLGFALMLWPASVNMVRRFVADARRLAMHTGTLRGEVQARTEERDRAEHALVEAERLAALGRLAAGVGHEINNPLAYLRGSLEHIATHLAAHETPDTVREALADALDGTRRIEHVVEGLRSYSRRVEAPGPLDLAAAVQAALTVAQPKLRHSARISSDLSVAGRILGDEARLCQAIVSLLLHAGQGLEGRGGTIAVRTFASEARHAGEAREVGVEIVDDGPGIPERLLPHLAEPTFATRAAGAGLGLGLFIAHGIARAHGGRLELESSGSGTRARLCFPALTAAAPSADALAAEAEPSPAPAAAHDVEAPRRPSLAAPAAALDAPKPRLLIIDDEPALLRAVARRFKRAWDVTLAGSGAEALALLRAERAFDAVVCDLMMPNMSGIELADELERSNRALRARMVFMTGGAVTEAAEAFLQRADVHHFEKPIDFAALDATLQRLRSRVCSGGERDQAFDANRAGLELGGAALRVEGVDGEPVGVDVVREVQRHEREPG